MMVMIGWLLDNESAKHYVGGIIKEGLLSTKPDLGSIDINSIADNCTCHLLDSECPDKSVAGSMETGLTMACSFESDTLEDDSSYNISENSRGSYVGSAIDS